MISKVEVIWLVFLNVWPQQVTRIIASLYIFVSKVKKTNYH